MKYVCFETKFFYQFWFSGSFSPLFNFRIQSLLLFIQLLLYVFPIFWSTHKPQAFEELEDLLAKHNICIAVKEKLVKDSGVAEEIAYDNIVQKLLTKPRARGKFGHFTFFHLFNEISFMLHFEYLFWPSYWMKWFMIYGMRDWQCPIGKTTYN